MSLNRKWLKALVLAMMAIGSFASPMDPKEIEELMRTMNQTRIEFTLPNEDYKGGDKKPADYRHD
ncbi:MAG: hypothetical protein WB994_09030 [Candidatus Acidiferrum sp.]